MSEQQPRRSSLAVALTLALGASLCLGALLGLQGQARAMADEQVLISAVLYDGYQYLDLDEAVQLINVGPAPVDLTGWEICKDVGSGLGCRDLPSVVLSPTERIWLAREATGFADSFGFAPGHEMTSWLPYGLSNDGDEVILRDDAGDVVDVLVYEGGNTGVIGWSGPAVRPYGVGRADGQVLARVPDEATGLPVADTDAEADWIQHTGSYTRGRRVRYPGWDQEPLFWPLTATTQATVTVGIAPDNAFQVVSQTIALARHSIRMEVYSLRHPDVVTALVQSARAGVSVTVLLEGGPAFVNTSDPNALDWQQERWACQEIEAAGGQCWFMIHETGDRVYSRYEYVHAKFLVVDDEWALISSQNPTVSGMPSDDKANGTHGSRGVVLATNAPPVVARAAQVWSLDLDPACHNDLVRWNTAYTDAYGPPDPAYTPVLTLTDHTTYTVRFPTPQTFAGTFDFELFTAPEAALRQTDALLGLVGRAGAGDEVYVEQMYEYVDWGDDPVDDPNLRLAAYVDAARRGARVRILLNGGAFGADFADPSGNAEPVMYVNAIARAEGLDLRAILGDPTRYGIHNKMVLVRLHDAGGYIHVGSINGSESSSKVNREMAIQVRSDAIYDHLKALFDVDWSLSQPVYLPLAMREYVPPPPPVNYLVLSEVYYAGSTSTEWAEVYNPTDRAIDLSSYKIGDAAHAGDYEGMYRFPSGTVIPPGGVLVVAFDGTQVPQADFELFDNSATPDMTRLPALGKGDWGLRNAGDQVLLLGPTNQAVDVLAWGDKGYPGVVSHPGVTIFTRSLERYPPYYDTDDCIVDWRENPAPGPGQVPSPGYGR